MNMLFLVFLGLASATELNFKTTSVSDCTFSHSASGISSSCNFTSSNIATLESRIATLETKVQNLETSAFECAGDSLVQNGGFENGAIDSIPEGWSRYSAYGNTGLVSNEVAHCGSKSIKYTGDSWQLIENGGVDDQAAELELEAGKTYEITFWAYSTTAGQHIRSEFLNYPGTSDGDSYNGRTITTTDSPNTYVVTYSTAAANTWEKFTHTIRPNTGSSSRVNLGPSSVIGALYLDDFSVQVIASFSTCVTANSMIKNGGVEIGSDGNYAVGWSRYGAYGDTGLVSKEVAHCGSSSLKFTGTSWQLVENGGVDDATYAISLNGGETYCLSAFVYGNAGKEIRTEFLKYGAHGDQDGYLSVLATTPAGVDEDYVKYHILSATNVWQEIEHCFIPTETTPIVRMNIGPSDTDNTAMYLDDMTLEIL